MKRPKIELEGSGKFDSMGCRQGVWEFYFADHDAMYARGAFKNGDRVGEWRYSYPDGPLAASGEHQPDGVSAYTGEWSRFHPNGVRAESTVYDDIGFESGPSSEWYSNGRIARRTQYEQSDENGPTNLWYANGKKMAEGEISCDMHVGVWTYWHDNGQVAFVERWGELPPVEGYFDREGRSLGYDDFWARYLDTFTCEAWETSSAWPDGGFAGVDVWEEWRPRYHPFGIELPLSADLLDELLRWEWVQRKHGFRPRGRRRS